MKALYISKKNIVHQTPWLSKVPQFAITGGHEPYDAKADLWSVASLVDLGCYSGLRWFKWVNHDTTSMAINGNCFHVFLGYV
jgi:hypothetical protein